MTRTRRMRRLPTALIAAAVIIACVVALAIHAEVSAAAGTDRYSTATVSRGTITASLTGTGALTSANRSVSFPAAGTVTSTTVQVGTKVTAGQVLARMQTSGLQLAVLQAEAQLAADQAALAQAQAGTTATDSTTTTGSTTAGTQPGIITDVDDGTGHPGEPGRADAGSNGESNSGTSGVTNAGNDAATLDEQLTGQLTQLSSLIDVAQAAAAAQEQACASLPAAPTDSSSPSPADPSPTTATTPGATTGSACLAATGAALHAEQQVADQEQAIAATAQQLATALAASGSGTPSAHPSNRPSTAPSGHPSSGATGPTGSAQPGHARTGAPQQTGSASRTGSHSQTGSHTQNGQGSQGGTGNSAGPGNSTGAGSSAGAGNSSGAGGGSVTTVATAQAKVAADQVALAVAQHNLADATLTSPIAGTVAAQPFVAGSTMTTTDAIVIVAPGASTITLQVSAGDYAGLHLGQRAAVTVDTAHQPTAGTVSAIGLLPTAGSTSTTTYPVTVTVPHPPRWFTNGASATVTVTLSTARDVVEVPASAVTTIAPGRGSVQLLIGGAPTRTSVGLGIVGDGMVQITSGAEVGQTVVLADRAAAVPSATSGRALFEAAGGFRGSRG